MVASMSLGNGNGNGNGMRQTMSKLLVPKERVVERAQGCWNCKHWDAEAAKPLWNQKRQNDLAKALELSLKTENKQGEDHPHVVNIRRMVDNLDHMVASKSVGVCSGDGRTANGQPVGDFVAHSFLCDRWSGVQGASMTREGGKIDDLPEEVAQKLDDKLGQIDLSTLPKADTEN
jgi:hypothetical protein